MDGEELKAYVEKYGQSAGGVEKMKPLEQRVEELKVRVKVLEREVGSLRAKVDPILPIMPEEER